MKSESAGAGGYLVCERWPVFALMMLTGGYFGAFTYTIRGGVFCNAQTGNFVLLAMALGRGEWVRASCFLIPITAYCLGALPETAPVQITQVLINFMCSMQYNTFRQAQGIPMATTFCTNHIRQVGVSLYELLAGRGGDQARRLGAHLGMLGAFVAGGAVSAFLCGQFLGRAIWFAEIPLGLALADLLRADLGKEREKLEQLPHGH